MCFTVLAVVKCLFVGEEALRLLCVAFRTTNVEHCQSLNAFCECVCACVTVYVRVEAKGRGR